MRERSPGDLVAEVAVDVGVLVAVGCAPLQVEVVGTFGEPVVHGALPAVLVADGYGVAIVAGVAYPEGALCGLHTAGVVEVVAAAAGEELEVVGVARGYGLSVSLDELPGADQVAVVILVVVVRTPPVVVAVVARGEADGGHDGDGGHGQGA